MEAVYHFALVSTAVALLSACSFVSPSHANPTQISGPSTSVSNSTVVPSNTTVYLVPRETTDPKIRNGDSLNLVVFKDAKLPSKLLVYIGGSNSYAGCVNKPFFDVALRNGYRVVSLDFKYEPPANAVCLNSDDESCYRRCRESKVFGTNCMPELNVAPSESIVNRLAALITYLAKKHPQEGWRRYLRGNNIQWSEIAISGTSQSAGLAAFLAKYENVNRVILFSSPWDHFQKSGRLAEWLSKPSATPKDNWYAAYHEKEESAPWIVRSYNALGIPQSHVRKFSLEPIKPAWLTKDPRVDVYHVSTTASYATPRSPEGHYLYENDWSFLLGAGQLRE
jgi:hypothetical protein